MYLTTIKIKREGDKPVNEQYLVEAVNLTDVETKVTRDFQGVDLEITSCKVINFVEIFENGESTFYEIKNQIETIDDKKVVELYLIEDNNDESAMDRFRGFIVDGSTISFIKKPYMGIIR